MKKKLFALFLALSLALSLAACGGIKQPIDSDVDLGEFYETLLEESEWPSQMTLENEQIDAFFPGLLELELKQCLVSTAAISSAAGEIVLVEVEDAADAKTVEDIFQARIDYQVGDGNGPGGAFYPETMEAWENNSRIVTHGNFVMLAVCDQADQAVEAFDALFQ